MKKIRIVGLVLILIGFQSCKKNEDKKETEKTNTETEQLATEQCYKAVYEKDTLDLKITPLKDGKIGGSLVMKVFDEPKREGKIEGEFKGDTLFCSYTFILTKDVTKTYKNPMAFLKQGDELILGNGEIEMYLGASYFKKDKPIDFEKVKYKFASVDCSTKTN
ncbi:MAG: hypothetical protein LCH35_02540 [Bacteroidetes bacterium]|jgi:hypothetical protein|uniref:hypothetical protein n=1 Tax=Flavobacterium sp. TaxID=239 RepID=UPI002FD8E41B|nr:hypothetical protein [Bacteroidota bacterium]